MNNVTTKTAINTYEQTANDFAEQYNLKLSIGEPTYKDHWNDGQMRWVFPCKLSRNGKSYSFKFGQSIAAGKEKPNMYDILACMTKYDPESFEFFCSNYGYDTDSRKAYKTYLSVCREYEGMCRLFDNSETIFEELQEIN